MLFKEAGAGVWMVGVCQSQLCSTARLHRWSSYLSRHACGWRLQEGLQYTAASRTRHYECYSLYPDPQVVVSGVCDSVRTVQVSSVGRCWEQMYYIRCAGSHACLIGQ